MQKILRKKSENIVHKFENESEDFHITVNSDVNTKFGAIVKNSQISFTFDVKSENADIECHFLISAIKNQNIKLDIFSNIKAKNTKILINVIALADDNAQIELNGNLHILD